MENIEKNQYQINIKNVFISVLQEKWLILLIGLAVALSAFIYSRVTSTPVYKATTNVYILNNTNNSVQYSDVQTAAQLTKDYEELIKDVSVTEQVIAKLNLNLTPGQLANRISVTAKDDTRIIAISVVDTDPYLAAKIANMVRQVAAVDIVDIMKIDAVNLISEASIPNEKTGSGAVRNTVLAFIFAVALSVAAITVIDVVNDTIKTPEDIINRLDLNSLGAIPMHKERIGSAADLYEEGDED